LGGYSEDDRRDYRPALLNNVREAIKHVMMIEEESTEDGFLLKLEDSELFPLELIEDVEIGSPMSAEEAECIRQLWRHPTSKRIAQFMYVPLPSFSSLSHQWNAARSTQNSVV
jgi:hypothetical protein